MSTTPAPRWRRWPAPGTRARWGEPWRAIYALNPMVGVVEGFRWALLDAPRPPGPTLLVSSLAGVAVLAAGALYFKRTEDRIADVV